MVPTRTLPTPGFWKYAVHLAAGILVAATMMATSATTSLAGLPSFAVSTDVTDNGNNTWDYGYTVCNDTSCGQGEVIGAFVVGEGPSIIGFALPYFGDEGIVGITSPEGWAYQIETGTPSWAQGGSGKFGPGNPFYNNTMYLNWYTEGDGIADFSSLSGFGFTADYGPTSAPFQVSLSNGSTFTGDPQTPASPSAMGTQVPEPAALALFGFGLAGLAYARRRRKMKA